MEQKIIQLLPDGTLTVTEPVSGGERTVRYFDSKLQMILNVVEKTQDKTVMTKYMPDGHFIQSIIVETKDSSIVYQADGQTKIREKYLSHEGIWEETVYRGDGKTVRQKALYRPEGTAEFVIYQTDGQTKAQEIYQDDKGLSRTCFFDADGQTRLKMSEDLSDGSCRTFFYRDKTGVIDYVETGPLKGETKSNVYLIETYDKTGKKVVSRKKEER